MKTITVKMLSPLLALVMLLASALLIASCNGNVPAETTEGNSDSTSSPFVDTEPLTEAILISALSQYDIIRPEKVSETLKDKISFLYQKITAKYEIDEYRDDFYREGVEVYEMGEYEILVGKTNRPETEQFLSTLKYNDFGFAQIGNKIVIAGHSDQATMNAIDEFIFTVVNAKDPEEGVFYKSEYDYLQRVDYKVGSILIGETPIEEFSIVYPFYSRDSENLAAEKIAEHIAAVSGIVMKVTDDKAPTSEYEILIGATNRNTEAEISAISSKLGESESIIKFDGKKIIVYGTTPTAILTAVSELNSKLTAEKTDKLTVSLEAEQLCKYNDSILTAMSFNVWVSSRTGERDDRVIKMVTDYLPDTVGFQEVNASWLSTLRAGLKETYAIVGEGRDGGTKGEYNPIFYKKDVFNLIDSGTKWLSDTPDSVSKYEESSLNRIYTYALLERKSDGTKIMVINTHFDHKSAVAREKQAEVIIKAIAEFSEYPIVLTGDFNCESGSAAYSIIRSSGIKNAGDIADKKINSVATFTNYGASNKIIDFAFVTEKNISVVSYKVCNEKINGDYPSDHHPVLIEYAVIG